MLTRNSNLQDLSNMLGLFNNHDKIIDHILERSAKMEKYYLDKAVEYLKFINESK